MMLTVDTGDIKELNGVDIADRHVIAALGDCDILNRKVSH